MKKLNVTIKLEMSVPDDWELAETSEGTHVLKLPNGQFLDLTIEGNKPVVMVASQRPAS